MVFSGRPSTACLACRKRRLKCDRLPEGCSQCRRKGIKCAGYRDPSALRMRDETTRVADKFEKRQKHKNIFETLTVPSVLSAMEATGVTMTDRPLGWSPLAALSKKVTGPLPSLQNALSDASMSYFLSSYTSASPCRDYITIFCKTMTEDACSTAIFATALAAYAGRVRCPRYLDMAGKEYARALAQLNVLLSKPKTAVLDRTLAAVLILGLFETIVFEPGVEPTSWVAHVFGSLQLLRLRGPEQLNNEVSILLLDHACSNIRMTCAQKSIPIPADVLDYESKLCIIKGASQPSSQVTLFSQKIAEFKLKLKADPGCNLIQEALRIDQQIVNLIDAAPEWMDYKIETGSAAPTWVHRGISHRYSSVQAAKFWNAIRLTRYYFLHHINEALSGRQPGLNVCDLRIPDSDGNVAEWVSKMLQSTRKGMIALTEDMLASMAAFMESDEFGHQRFSPAARSLAWPLAVIENTDVLEQSTREYASRYLEIIAGDLNMHKIGRIGPQSTSLKDGFYLYHIG